jgi:hypothetical protein
MAKGEVYRHSQFEFHDGQVGEKLIVVLNDPASNEPYIVARTTSNLRHKTYSQGCNQKFGVFFVMGKSEGAFPLDTLIQLVETYEFSAEEFLRGALTDKTISPMGTLSAIRMAQLVNCIRSLREDMIESHFRLITR